MSTITQDVVVLNDFGDASIDRRTRTTSRGTTDRYTVTIKAEPILHDFSGLRLGKAPAEAIADLLRRQIRAIGTFASLATRQRRERAARNPDARANARRYSGGRTGAMPPNQTGRLFNDSGRLAAGITAMENREEKAWTINVTANRLDPTTFPAAGTFDSMLRRLAELAPAFRGGAEILRDETVMRAISTATAEAIVVLRESADARSRQAIARLAGTVYRQLVKPVLLG